MDSFERHLAQGMDKWLALVDTLIKIRVPQKAENFLCRWVIELLKKDYGPLGWLVATVKTSGEEMILGIAN
jgi:hypothetical protein